MVHKEKRFQIPFALLAGTSIGMIITLAAAMVVAALVAVEKLDESSISIGAMVSIMLGSGTCALISASKVGNMRLVMCLSSGATYLLALMFAAVICFDGVKAGIGVTAVVTMGVALAVSLLGQKRGNRGKYKLPKVRI